jgi:cytidylate kinase
MRPAPDAVLLDTTDLDIDSAFDAARRIVEAARGRWEKSHRANPNAP